LKSPGICKEVVKVDVIYLNHSKRKTPETPKNRAKQKNKKIFEKPGDL